MSHLLVEDIAYLFSEISNRDNNLLNEESDYYDEELAELVEDMISTISLSMIYEGYSASAIISFLADSSDQDLIEKYFNFDENVITESVVSDEYIQEQAYILESLFSEAKFSGLKNLLKRVATKPARAAAAKRMASSKNPEKTRAAYQRLAQREARKGNAGGYSKTSSPVDGGKKMSATQSAELLTKGKIGQATQKVREIGSKIKTASPKIAKGALIAGTGVLAGYAGAKLSGGGGGGVAKPEPSGGAPKPKGGAGYVDVPGKGKRYYASSDKKYYKNYNDALAARNSRRGVTPAAPSAAGGGGGASGGDGTGGGGFAKPAPAKPVVKQTGDKAKDMETWAKANPELAKKVKDQPKRSSLSADVEDIKQMQQRSKQRRGAEMGGEEGPGKVDPKSVESDIAAEKERQRKRAESATKKESYDFYDVVLQYLFDTEQVESVAEANYVMSEMSEEDINLIVENYQLV